MTRYVLATRNAHKVGELRRILGAAGPELVALAEFPPFPDPVESGVTFAANALIKAHATARATGLPAIADDSGLCVAVLGGAPGVFSARWSGRHGDDPANLDLLLAQLSDVPDEHRAAWFACAAAVARPDGSELVVEGRQDGVLLRERHGTGGFGYDPIFRGAGQAGSNAELTPEQKDAVSHRGRAFRALVPLL